MSKSTVRADRASLAAALDPAVEAGSATPADPAASDVAPPPPPPAVVTTWVVIRRQGLVQLSSTEADAAVAAGRARRATRRDFRVAGRPAVD